VFTTEQALSECLPYYVGMFDQMKREALTAKASV
jgi:3beta-hydroxy-delta5-steroid dehydrogenase/steroid delta-isomerase